MRDLRLAGLRGSTSTKYRVGNNRKQTRGRLTLNNKGGVNNSTAEAMRLDDNKRIKGLAIGKRPGVQPVKVKKSHLKKAVYEDKAGVFYTLKDKKSGKTYETFIPND